MKPATRFEGPSEAMRLALATYCEAMHDLTADVRWRAAAGILIGKRQPGRPPVDDRAALQYAQALLDAGAARSVHRACQIAAQMFAPEQVEAMHIRLRRKLSGGNIKSGDGAKKGA